MSRLCLYTPVLNSQLKPDTEDHSPSNTQIRSSHTSLNRCLQRCLLCLPSLRSPMSQSETVDVIRLLLCHDWSDLEREISIWCHENGNLNIIRRRFSCSLKFWLINQWVNSNETCYNLACSGLHFYSTNLSLLSSPVVIMILFPYGKIVNSVYI